MTSIFVLQIQKKPIENTRKERTQIIMIHTFLLYKVLKNDKKNKCLYSFGNTAISIPSYNRK